MDEKVAKEDIYLAGQLIYPAGSPVDMNVVKREGWEKKVVGSNTKTARELRGEMESDEDEAPQETGKPGTVPGE